ncbi:SDR family NAD(P)-dependent oxidoreductase [bacterium]|nr:SDR family NAD(P)-dependent oxidoreductase [bacterium]
MAHGNREAEMNRNAKYYALVTGASQGLGRALAEELARRGHNLFLAALPGTGLPELSDSLAGRYNIMVRFVETDLMRREAPAELLEFTRANNIETDILINNVGIGHGGAIGDYSDAAIEESVFLNMRCTTLMTNTFKDELCKRGRAYILNIGSFGGFMPVPYKSVYTATKSFVFNFTLAVREELRNHGVSVSVAMPGGIITNGKVRERVNKLGPLGKLNALEPDEAARYLIDRMFRGRSVIIPGFTMRTAYFIGCALPFRLLLALTGKIFRGIN